MKQNSSASLLLSLLLSDSSSASQEKIVLREKESQSSAVCEDEHFKDSHSVIGCVFPAYLMMVAPPIKRW